MASNPIVLEMDGPQPFNPYGFYWGPVEVSRLVHVEGRGRVLSVRTEHAEVQVYVSEKGRKIRVWCGNEELT